jgi:hypothetical protein
MNPNPIPQSSAARWLLWWILWAGILAGLVAIYFVLGEQPAAVPTGRIVATDFVGLVWLLASCLVRWLVLPRVRSVQSAFVLFVVGMALAESCGLMGIFLSAFRNELFVLGMLGIVQWMPLFARIYCRPATAAFPPPER